MPTQLPRRRLARLLSTCAAALLPFVAAPVSTAQAETRGVTDTEILIGTITDLSGVTAVQGVNNSDAIRLAFEEVNARGGIHGRKIRYIVEDNQYQVPRAVQAMNKLLNRDNVFFTMANGGTPMNNANMPAQLEKGVPNVFPLTAARSMYEPFHHLKFGQFASYYDQMRAGVKYFVEVKGKKSLCMMYQDTDFGRDVLAGMEAQAQAMGLKVVATTTHKPTDVDFNTTLQRLRDAKCDLIGTATIVRDTILILSAARKMEWNVEFLGQFASYDTAVAEAPGGIGEGYYAVTPSLYAYPDDPRPAVQDLAKRYKARYGREINYLGQMGWSAAQAVIWALDKAGRDLNAETFIKALESMKDHQDIFDSPPMSFSADSHHGSTAAWLAIIKNGRWVPAVDKPMGY